MSKKYGTVAFAEYRIKGELLYLLLDICEINIGNQMWLQDTDPKTSLS